MLLSPCMGQSLCESPEVRESRNHRMWSGAGTWYPAGNPQPTDPIFSSLPFLKKQMKPPEQDTEAMWAARMDHAGSPSHLARLSRGIRGGSSFAAEIKGRIARTSNPPCGGSLSLPGAFTQASGTSCRRPQFRLGLRSVCARPLEATGVADSPRGGVQAWSFGAVV